MAETSESAPTLIRQAESGGRRVSPLARFLAQAVLGACCTVPLVARCAWAADLSKLKKDVFSACEEAARTAQELTVDEEAEFISYLGRILAMPSASSGQLASEVAPLPPGAPNAPVGPLRDLNLWQVFQPTRELEAKRCALSLLKQQSPASVEVVPEMLELAAEKNASLEYRNMLIDTAWKISVETGKRGFKVPLEKLRRLLEQVTAENNGYAENILIELHSSSLPFLAAELKTPDPAKRARVREILLAIDPSGEVLGPVITPLLDSADDGLRTEIVGLLEILPGFYQQALPALINKLNDPSGEVVAAVYAALRKIAHHLPPLQLNEQQLKLLVQQFQRGNPEERMVLEPLIARASESSGVVEGDIRRMLDSSDTDLRSRAMRLSALTAKSEPSLFQIYISALYDDATEVRMAAIEALGLLPARSSESAPQLLRLLKSVSGEKDVEARQRLILQIAKVISSFPADQTVRRMTPYFVDALGYKSGGSSKPGESPSVEETAGRVLVNIGREALPSLLKALRASAPIVRRRALEVIFEIKPVDKKTLRALIDLFKDRDPSVREALINGLAALGGEGIIIAKDALALPELAARMAAARLLLKLNIKDPATAGVLSQGLAGLPCKEGAAFAADILVLDPTRREFVEGKLLDCLTGDENGKAASLDALEQIAPLSTGSLERIESLLKNDAMPADTRLRIAYRSKDFGLPGENLTPILLSLLGSSDNSIRNRVVSLLAEVGPGASGAVDELKKIVANKDEEPLIQNRSVVALTRIKPSEVNYIDFLLDEMRSDRYQWAQSAMKDLPPELLLPLLKRAMAELPDERKPLAVRAVGRVGPAAQTLEDDLLRLAQAEDANLRYQACVSLLRLDPKRPEVVALVRAELVGKNRRRFLVEKLPPDALETIQAISQNPESFVELRAAQELLAANRGAE